MSRCQLRFGCFSFAVDVVQARCAFVFNTLKLGQHEALVFRQCSWHLSIQFVARCLLEFRFDTVRLTPLLGNLSLCARINFLDTFPFMIVL